MTITRSNSVTDGTSRSAPARTEPRTHPNPPVAAALAGFRGRPARILTGDRPTGELHLGHYFGTVQNRVALQDAGADVLIVIADYQVITDRDGVGPLRERVLGLVADQLACGVDPERSTLFVHSAVPALNQLMLPFLSLVSDSELRRNPTVKEELEHSGRPLSGLLLTYPVHQAADILFCDADLVPVGADQLPHLELTRTIARRFNDRYGTVFTQPRALLSPTPRLPGLDGVKMSKSRGNAITLRVSEDETAMRIRRAITDSERYITYAPERRPGVSALLSIIGVCEQLDPRVIAEQIGNGGASALKRRATEAVNERLREVRQRHRLISADPAQLVRILVTGGERASELAQVRLGAVRSAMQMDYR